MFYSRVIAKEKEFFSPTLSSNMSAYTMGMNNIRAGESVFF